MSEMLLGTGKSQINKKELMDFNFPVLEYKVN